MKGGTAFALVLACCKPPSRTEMCLLYKRGLIWAVLRKTEEVLHAVRIRFRSILPVIRQLGFNIRIS